MRWLNLLPWLLVVTFLVVAPWQAFAQCSHSECEPGEALDTACSPCAGMVCGADPFCCGTTWDSLCVTAALATCPACGPTCGDGVCAAGETCTDCAQDCGPCAVCGDGQVSTRPTP